MITFCLSKSLILVIKPPYDQTIHFIFLGLFLAGVVRESGNIVKCFDEVCGDFIISDELRKVSWSLVECVGGGICKWVNELVSG